MTAQMFIAVLCLLAMKYTLDLAGSTRQRRARQPLGARLRRAPTTTPKLWVVIATSGALLLWVGVVSDKPSAGLVLAFGLALSHFGVFLAGVRSAGKRRAAEGQQRRASSARPVLAQAADGVSSPQLVGASR